jgi:hypothetical protein
VPSGYRAPTHMAILLTQYCDLRQWCLVDRPYISLGLVQVRILFALAALAARRGRDTASSDTESAGYDVPSDILYGSAHYKKLVTAGPESHWQVSVPHSDSDVYVPGIQDGRQRARASTDLSDLESTAD